MEFTNLCSRTFKFMPDISKDPTVHTLLIEVIAEQIAEQPSNHWDQLLTNGDKLPMSSAGIYKLLRLRAKQAGLNIR